MNNNPIYVTSPLLPNLQEFESMLEDIWQRKWLTNNGHYHQELEKALSEYLRVPYLSLFTNGTLPLITALQAMRITGEVITTPYSFVATTHSIWWNNLKPVFVDVEESTGNIDVNKIEAAITPQTTAIMPVHVYGTPCNTKRIQEIADIYGGSHCHSALIILYSYIPEKVTSVRLERNKNPFFLIGRAVKGKGQQYYIMIHC